MNSSNRTRYTYNLFSTRNIEKTANELINKALKRGSQDNISVVIVVFHQEEEEEYI